MASLHRRSAYRTDSDDPVASRPTKRLRKELDFNTLPNVQKDILAQAVEILRVPLTNAPDEVRRLQSAPTISAETSCWPHHQANRTMGSGSETPSAVASAPMLPPPQHGSGSHPVEEDLLLNDMISTPESRVVDSCFGFPVMPNRWSECLAGMALSEPPSREARPGHESFSRSSFCLGIRPETSVSQLPAQLPYLHNSHILDLTAQLPNMAEKSPIYGSSAGDFLLDPRFLTSIPVLTPMQVQNTQPTADKQVMTYPAVDDSLNSSQWNQNMTIGISTANHQGYTLVPNQLTDTATLSENANHWSDDGQDSDYLSSNEKTGNVRRGPFKNPQERAETAQTRKHAACVRCRMQRIRCRPDPSNQRGVCLTCKDVTNLKFCKQLPCLRYKITDVKLFKPGQVPGMEWTRRWLNQAVEDIYTWSSGEVKTIQVTEGYNSYHLTLQVREFVPLEGDLLQRHWVMNNSRRSATLPPYAIVDMASAEKAYWDYINQTGPEFFRSVLNYKDKLLWATYETAIGTANNPKTPDRERKLLNAVLRLWIAVRITTRSIRISGQETLGMTRNILDETSPLHGYIPVPPVMGAQIELILIQKIQVPLRGQVLDLLQKILAANQRTSWFAVYLSIFILLHNCALITKHDAGYARKHGIQARFARPAMVEEYHQGANILLTHFHYCNRGLMPFAMDGNVAQLTTLGGLDQRQVSLVENTRNYVKANKNRFEDLRWQKLVEHDHYFVAQLYEEDWKPRQP